MSNYSKTTNFTEKDGFLSGNPGKVIKGEEFDVEFNAISAAIITKGDLASPTFTGTVSLPDVTLGGTITGGSTSGVAISGGTISGAVIDGGTYT